MTTFTLKANARKHGAIGVFHHVVKTIEANALVDLMMLVNGYRCVNERVKYRIHRNKR